MQYVRIGISYFKHQNRSTRNKWNTGRLPLPWILGYFRKSISHCSYNHCLIFNVKNIWTQHPMPTSMRTNAYERGWAGAEVAPREGNIQQLPQCWGQRVTVEKLKRWNGWVSIDYKARTSSVLTNGLALLATGCAVMGAGECFGCHAHSTALKTVNIRVELTYIHFQPCFQGLLVQWLLQRIPPKLAYIPWKSQGSEWPVS